MQLGPQDAVDWRQHDAADEAAKDLGDFGYGFAPIERLGMEPQHRRRLAGAKQICDPLLSPPGGEPVKR